MSSIRPSVAHTFLSSRQISVSDDIFIVPRGSRYDNVIERPMFMPDATFHGYLLAFLSTLLQNQAIYPSLFVTHGSSLPLGNALCGFRHKQDFHCNVQRNTFVVSSNATPFFFMSYH